MTILEDVNYKGTTIILVTHDINIASFGDKIVHMKDGKI